MNDPGEFQDFEEFWAHFTRSHQSPAVRWCHVAALGCGALALRAALRRRPGGALALGAVAAALAVGAHYVVEGKGPENFRRPLWAARAFLRLCTRTALGTWSEA